jgi:REP element-mobilizing transposase RayT
LGVAGSQRFAHDCDVPDLVKRRGPTRPQRLPQLYSSVRPFFFVTFNTYDRRRMLADIEIHEAFRSFCQRAEKEHRIAVGRYVLMPDHVHLFVALPPDGMTLDAWMQSLRSVLGKTLLKLGSNKPHWQEGFFDHVLRSSESYTEKWEYVRMNPVRARLCAAAEEWPCQGEIVPLRFE